MDYPVQVTFHGVAHSPALDAAIRERAARLERYRPHVIRCRAVVEKQERHGAPFTVKLEIQVEGEPLVVISHEHESDPLAAVRKTFDAARHRLDAEADRRGEPGRRARRRHIPPAG